MCPVVSLVAFLYGDNFFFSVRVGTFNILTVLTGYNEQVFSQSREHNGLQQEGGITVKRSV